ncbi:hypothetical protein V7266_09590 [Neobacillus drentensis]|uniref:hypothetical protein n=1 Tax=Neobacillus drentensis TaxID=220684 RepID=UPI00300033DD
MSEEEPTSDSPAQFQQVVSEEEPTSDSPDQIQAGDVRNRAKFGQSGPITSCGYVRTMANIRQTS